MPRKKIQRFKELASLPNVTELSQSNAKQKLSDFLTGTKPILELACGKGEYTIALAEKYPNKKFIGIDIQGERLWFGAKKALDKNLSNIFFLRIQIEDLKKYFNKNSISEIWITFPDPFPRKRQVKKRLTSPGFLKMYQYLLVANACVNLKTDDLALFEYSIYTAEMAGANIISVISDVYKQKKAPEILTFKTYYENKHLKANKSINYLKFCFK